MRAFAPGSVTAIFAPGETADRSKGASVAIDLPTDEVRETVAEVEAAGGDASMAMVGETVFAVGVEGVLPNRTTVCSEGAHLR